MIVLPGTLVRNLESFRHVRIMLPDYVWRYIHGERKVLYCVFNRPTKQVFSSWVFREFAYFLAVYGIL